MSKKNETGYLSAKESRRISRENRRITDQLEKRHKRKNVPESEYLTQMKDPNNALEIENLHTYFFSDVGTVRAVDGVSFDVPIGKTVGVVGESGCGKSVTSLSIMQLLQRPQGQIVDGEIRLNLGNGKCYDITKTPTERMQNLRGNYMSMIFQEPMTSLNPVFTIGRQIMESLLFHGEKDKKRARERAIEMLRLVGIPDPEKSMERYPHQISGGMRQRVMIAMALSCQPNILIADEPTTALDVTIQAQILRLIGDLRKKLGTAIILITHDLGIVAQTAENVLVMYGGQAVEYSDVKSIYKQPLHPYTVGLLKSIPKLHDQQKRLYNIKGSIPSPKEFPEGCRFSPRCEECMEICRTKKPELVSLPDGRRVRCWKYALNQEKATAKEAAEE